MVLSMIFFVHIIDFFFLQGIINVVDRALLVPRSVFQELHASPRFFSTLLRPCYLPRTLQ